GDTSTVRAGDVVVLGGTRAVVRPFERQRSGRRDRLGQIAFHRTPYRPPVVRPVEGEQVEPVGPIPTRPEPRRLQLVAVVAPLVAGVAMYVITRQAMFLLFTLISPVVMVGTAIDDRRSGRRSFADELVTFRAMLAARRRAFDDLALAERMRRHRAAPDIADLARRAELRTIDLWERGRDAPDALHLRLGLGDDRAMFEVALAAGGDADLRAEAERALHGADRLEAVPVNHPLGERHLAVHGDRVLVDGTAAALVLHTAVLHSPDDVAVALAVDPERHLDWTKWLPHLRAVTSPLAGAHLVLDTDGANDLIDRLIAVAEQRTADTSQPHGVHWPRVVAVIDATLRPDPTAVARLLDSAIVAGISVIWLADRAADVPRQAGSVLAVSQVDGARLVGRLWSTDPDVADRDLELDHVRPTAAVRAARALAPIRDASTSSLATAIPRTVPLFDAVGVPDATAIVSAWTGDGRLGLPFVIGVGADGPVELDLVADGPHTLIGGTSGAGKSELLQSLVTSLALRHAPTRLNFLFVDYKGGASSQVFERLPHTVGYVTNLSADLAGRALISLRAELERRMELLEGRAKDLADLLARDPASAPPSLVIVVDEFATLVKEVPDFVAGIVDIAQRGRSLGIHLVLATQRPTGAVDENILANTNLRIALRMLDRSESSAILDSPEAAEIPAPLRGRALVRRGPRQLVEFQSAYAGAPTARVVDRPPVSVVSFDRPDATASSSVEAPDAEASTQLGVALDAIDAANRELRLPPPRRPWRETLPSVVRLADVVEELDAEHLDEPGRSVTLGRFDAPERQAQGPATVDLERTGGLAVFGSGGTGKTTLLRTIAAGIERAGAGAVTVVFDFAGRGLGALGTLASVIDVATGDDLEAVTRHLIVLDSELRRRTALLAASGAEHLTAHHRAGGERLDRIVVLIDGFDVVVDTLLDPLAASSTGDSWSDVVHRLIVDGRRVGVHTVVAADRRAAIPTRLQAAIGSRLILRHADPQSYADLGVSTERAAALADIAGRALLDGVTVQVAVEGDDPSAQGQSAGIRRLAQRPDPDRPDRRHPTPSVGSVPSELRSVALPERVESYARAGFAVADVSGDEVRLDLDWSHAVIVGPARSGRSTALSAAFADVSGRCSTGSECYVVGPTASPLARLRWPAGHSRFGRAVAIAELLDRVANRLAVIDPDDRVVLFVDDLDALDDPLLDPLWTRLLEHDGLRIVASMETRSMSGYTTSSAVGELRRCRRLLVLQPDDPTEFLQLTGVRLALRPGLRLVPGRGVLLVDRRPTVVQVIDTLTERASHSAPSGSAATHEGSVVGKTSTVS
ncbi:MAG: hypothetical protein CL424_00370, partial [Acidimicrobiaceae bacterium]|nr:hypothetical protein [Acidimicrobiaceae bacterium]